MSHRGKTKLYKDSQLIAKELFSMDRGFNLQCLK